LELSCPNCQAKIATDEAQGGIVRCPVCGKSLSDPTILSVHSAPDIATMPTLPRSHPEQGARDSNQRPVLSPAPEAWRGSTDPPESTAPFPSVPGYKILSILGRGGMGMVYKALQIRLKRTVALKMILAGSHAGKDLLARFKTEAEAIARLQHP